MEGHLGAIVAHTGSLDMSHNNKLSLHLISNEVEHLNAFALLVTTITILVNHSSFACGLISDASCIPGDKSNQAFEQISYLLASINTIFIENVACL